jgi:hypothetical protein
VDAPAIHLSLMLKRKYLETGNGNIDMIYLRPKVLLVVHEPRSMVKLNFSKLGGMSGEAVENYGFLYCSFDLSFALS